LPPNPVLTLDQADYLPGENASILGTGFAPFETVSLQVRHADEGPEGRPDEWSWSVAADADGAIQTTWHVCEDGCANSVLELNAVGTKSGLATVVSFSDGYISNGGFESATLLGWSVVRSGEQQANWYLYSGNLSPLTRQPIQAPPEGLRAVVTDHVGAGYQVLYQDLILEPGFSHRLSFKVYYRNWADAFYTPDNFNPFGFNQQYRVDLIRPATPILSLAAADILATPFRTKPGDPLQLAPTLITADLTPFAGSIVRLRFGVVQTLNLFHGSVDDVQLVSTPRRCLALQCPEDIVVGNDAGECVAKANFPMPLAVTACPGSGAQTAAQSADDVTITCVPPSGSVFLVGTTIVHCTATDTFGNTATCSFNVTVRDSEAPVIRLSPATPLAYNPTDAEIAAAFGAASVTDNCSADLVANGILQPEQGDGCVRSVTKVWTATDAAGNLGTASQTISFVRDTSAPTIRSLAGPTAPIPLGTAATITASLLEECSGIASVSFDWNDGSAPISVSPTSTPSAVHQYTTAGTYAVRLTVRDSSGNQAEELLQFVVVYDPMSGCVTGGGSIESRPGACPGDPELIGKATFGFVCKYAKGSETPKGETQFQVRNGDLKFHSQGYEWLVLIGGKAQFKGYGLLNGAPGYEFLVTATDAQLGTSQGTDKFQIKIWDTHGVVYDSGLGTADESQPITQGNIAIR
jgi:hypothetical protein